MGHVLPCHNNCVSQCLSTFPLVGLVFRPVPSPCPISLRLVKSHHDERSTCCVSETSCLSSRPRILTQFAQQFTFTRQFFVFFTFSGFKILNQSWRLPSALLGLSDGAKKPTPRNRSENLAVHPPKCGENCGCWVELQIFTSVSTPPKKDSEILVCVHLPSKTQKQSETKSEAKTLTKNGNFDKEISTQNFLDLHS